MKRFSEVIGSRSYLLLSASGLVAVAAPVVLGLVYAAPSRAQSQSQTLAIASNDFKYEVASIKAVPTDMIIKQVFQNSPYEFIASSISVQMLIRNAYGVEDNQILGARDWINSQLYEIHAKTAESVADKLQKLSPHERTRAYQEMLQDLLAERFKLTIHHETKVLPTYELVIAKSGIRLQEAKPGDSYANGIMGPNGPSGAGAAMTGMDAKGNKMIIAQGVPITSLLEVLSTELSHHVINRTALTGKYDFTLNWTPDYSQIQGPPGGSPDGQLPLASPDTNGPSLFTAIQEQLGLKLQAGKSPVEGIVIDHIERPSGN